MSDISKSAEMAAKYEKLREFKFQSLLAKYLLEFSQANEQYMTDISKATGIRVSDISGYRCDRKVLTEEHAKKLAEYLQGFGANAKYFELMQFQKVGEMVDLRGKTIIDELQELLSND